MNDIGLVKKTIGLFNYQICSNTPNAIFLVVLQVMRRVAFGQ